MIERFRRLAGLYQVGVLGAAYFLVTTNIIIIAPLVGFMRQQLHLSDLETAAILAAFPVVALPSNLIMGPLADIVGRRKCFVWGAIGSSVAFLLSAISTTGLEICTLRAVCGAFVPMMGASIFAAIPDYFDSEHRVSVTAYVTAAASLAHLLAIPGTIMIAETMGWRASFVTLSGYTMVLAVLAFMLPPAKYSAASKERLTFLGNARGLVLIARQAGTRTPLLGYLLHSCGVFIFLGSYPTWMLVQTGLLDREHVVSTVFLFGGLAGLIGAMAVARFGTGFRSPASVCAVLSALTVLSVGPVPFGATNLAIQMGGYGGLSLIRAVLLPTFISYTMSMVDARHRGALNGVANATFQCASALGGALGVWLFSIERMYFLNVAASALLFIVATAVFGSARRQQPADCEKSITANVRRGSD
jgi:predicted MFS family arabinose efflux permease